MVPAHRTLRPRPQQHHDTSPWALKIDPQYRPYENNHIQGSHHRWKHVNDLSTHRTCAHLWTKEVARKQVKIWHSYNDGTHRIRRKNYRSSVDLQWKRDNWERQGGDSPFLPRWNRPDWSWTRSKFCWSTMKERDNSERQDGDSFLPRWNNDRVEIRHSYHRPDWLWTRSKFSWSTTKERRLRETGWRFRGIDQIDCGHVPNSVDLHSRVDAILTTMERPDWSWTRSKFCWSTTKERDNSERQGGDLPFLLGWKRPDSLWTASKFCWSTIKERRLGETGWRFAILTRTRLIDGPVRNSVDLQWKRDDWERQGGDSPYHRNSVDLQWKRDDWERQGGDSSFILTTKWKRPDWLWTDWLWTRSKFCWSTMKERRLRERRWTIAVLTTMECIRLLVDTIEIRLTYNETESVDRKDVRFDGFTKIECTGGIHDTAEVLLSRNFATTLVSVQGWLF